MYQFNVFKIVHVVLLLFFIYFKNLYIFLKKKSTFNGKIWEKN